VEVEVVLIIIKQVRNVRVETAVPVVVPVVLSVQLVVQERRVKVMVVPLIRVVANIVLVVVVVRVKPVQMVRTLLHHPTVVMVNSQTF